MTKDKIKLTVCCGGKLIFNNATGDYVCSICHSPAKTKIFKLQKKGGLK
jgi:hypothetical protein